MSIPIIGQKKGFLISFEGSDGTGKTTQVKLLTEALQTTGFKVSSFRSPGSSGVGEQIREIVKNPNSKLCAEAELLLMNADRAQLVSQKIRPALESGNICICDRFIYSTIVYQGFGRGIDMHLIKALIQYTVGDTQPDLTFVMNVSEENAAKRTSKRGTTDRFEQEKSDYQARIRQGFEWLITKESESNGKLVAINANGTIEDIHNEIYRCTAFRIGQLREGSLTNTQKLIIS